MDRIDEQPLNFKHYCRVCKKGFMSGRALGGHMRAHGIGDENGGLDDDDDHVSDWEEKLDGTSNKRMYQLRTNPNRFKSCRSCENCGKEFLSWKSFLEHGKCSSDDVSESLVSSPESEGEDEGGGGRRGGGGGWSKRKRSLRSKVGCCSSYPPSEEDDLLLARCLVQLANTMVDPPLVSETEESSASASKEEERRNPSTYHGAIRAPLDKAKGIANPKGLFECKACKKVFNSHQALGGHRASHKKVKGCYAAKQDQLDDNNIILGDDDMVTNDEYSIPSKSTSSFQFEQVPPLVGAARRKAKVHECSICHRVFSSGQALGGHKRCHWITSNAPDTSPITKFQFQDNIEPIHHNPSHNPKPKIENPEKLDLNVPAWAHMSGVRRDPSNPLSFEVPTDIHLQPWIGNAQQLPLNAQNQINNKNNNNNINNGNEINIKNDVDDEADSTLKLAKLSDLNDLKDMDTSANTSQWLQVGLGSRNEAAIDP